METTFSYIEIIQDEVKSAFNFRATSAEINQIIEKKLDSIRFDSARYNGPRLKRSRISKALSSFLLNVAQVEKRRLADERVLFCYEVNGRLYTTHKKGWSEDGLIAGNYRSFPEIESIILSGKSDNKGFYYPCGKVYFQ